jgi:hypothetical protein
MSGSAPERTEAETLPALQLQHVRKKTQQQQQQREPLSSPYFTTLPNKAPQSFDKKRSSPKRRQGPKGQQQSDEASGAHAVLPAQKSKRGQSLPPTRSGTHGAAATATAAAAPADRVCRRDSPESFSEEPSRPAAAHAVPLVTQGTRQGDSGGGDAPPAAVTSDQKKTEKKKKTKKQTKKMGQLPSPSAWSASSFSTAAQVPPRKKKFNNDDPLHFVRPPDEFDPGPRFTGDGVWVAYPEQQRKNKPPATPTTSVFEASSSVYTARTLHDHHTREAATAVPLLKKQPRAQRVGAVQYMRKLLSHRRRGYRAFLDLCATRIQNMCVYLFGFFHHSCIGSS